MLSKEMKGWREEVLLFFRRAPIAEAVKVLAEITGMVESRRITEKFNEAKK